MLAAIARRAREAGRGRADLRRRRERAAGRRAARAADRARRAVERRLPPHRARRADRRRRGLPPRLPRHAAGAGVGGQARLPLPGPALPVAAQAARARRRAASRATASCTSSRTTTRSRTSASASGSPTLADPATLRALTALLLLAPAAAAAVPGSGVRLDASRGGSSSITTTELRALDPRGPRRFVAQFARLATPEARRALPDPCDEATVRAPASSTPPSRTLDNPSVAAAPRPAAPAPRATRRSPTRGPRRSTAPCSRERAFVLRYLQRRPGTRSARCSSTSAPTFARPAVPEPLIAPPAGTGWRVAVVERGPAYGGHGTPPPFDARAARDPGAAPRCSLADPRRDRPRRPP